MSRSRIGFNDKRYHEKRITVEFTRNFSKQDSRGPHKKIKDKLKSIKASKAVKIQSFSKVFKFVLQVTHGSLFK